MTCSENKDLAQVNWAIGDYFQKNNFDNHDIEMHGYMQLDEPKGNLVLGHYGKGEILVVFDRRILPKESRNKELTFGAKHYQEVLKALYASMIKLCNEQEIPYISYAGEFFRKKEKEFFKKLDEIKDKIHNRLENAI